MGIKASFITQYCTQLKFELSQETLLGQGFQLLTKQKSQSFPTYSKQQQNKQIYSHYHSQKLFLLSTLNVPTRKASQLIKILEQLQLAKNEYLCNVIFYSSSCKKPISILQKQSKIKVFTQFSDNNLLNLIQNKIKEKQYEQQKFGSQIFDIPFKNLQIANFIHSLANFAEQVERNGLPVDKIDPRRFLIIEKQGSRIKYDINFQELVGEEGENNSYFSSQIWEQADRQSNSFFSLSNQKWEQKYQKSLIYALGMMTLHFLLLEPANDCYNYKSKQFCHSQLESKLEKLSNILQTRMKNNQFLVNSYFLDSQVENGQNTFEALLYDVICKMLVKDKNKRLGIVSLKNISKELLEKVRIQYSISKNNKSYISNIHVAQKLSPKIKSTDNSQLRSASRTQKSFIRRINTNNYSRDESHSTQALQNSKIRLHHLQPKKTASNKFLDKQNVQNFNNILQPPVINFEEKKISLNGFQKVRTTQNSFMQGFFINGVAHGLGKITKKTGQVVECVFHNNEVIQQIQPYCSK